MSIEKNYDRLVKTIEILSDWFQYQDPPHPNASDITKLAIRLIEGIKSIE